MIKKFITHLPGNSGHPVSLINANGKNVVIKQGQDRYQDHVLLFDRLRENGIPTPRIFDFSPWHMSMEYLPGISIHEYLETNDPEPLIAFLKNAFLVFQQQSHPRDFSRELDEKTRELEHMMPLDITLPIDLYDLRARLPDTMPWGLCHGDLSLENIIYYQDQFYFIDCSNKDLSSWYLDAGKLGQDLSGGWSFRYGADPVVLEKLSHITQSLSNSINEIADPYLQCFMLCRILPYCNNNNDKKFILERITSTWI